MFLSFVDGKVVINDNGEILNIKGAKAKYPKLSKQIDEYSKNAKKLFKLKLTSFTRETAKDNDVAYIHDIKEGVFFIINDSIIAYKTGEGSEEITDPIGILNEKQQLTDKQINALKNYNGVEIVWVNGTYFINGKQVSKDNFNFVKHYLERVELLDNGEFVYETNPSFSLNNLNLLSSISQSLENGSLHKDIYILSKNLRLIVESAEQVFNGRRYCKAYCYFVFDDMKISDDFLAIKGTETQDENVMLNTCLNQVKTKLIKTKFIEKALTSSEYLNLITFKIESLILNFKAVNKKIDYTSLKF